MNNQRKKPRTNKPNLILLEHVRSDKTKKRDCQCAVPSFLNDRANHRVECSRCGTVMAYETAFEIMEERKDERNKAYTAAYNQAVENERLAMEMEQREELARLRVMRLEKEAADLERKLAELKKTLGAV